MAHWFILTMYVALKKKNTKKIKHALISVPEQDRESPLLRCNRSASVYRKRIASFLCPIATGSAPVHGATDPPLRDELEEV